MRAHAQHGPRAPSYQVDLLMYCFQASLPDSLPPPVCFSPPTEIQNKHTSLGHFGITEMKIKGDQSYLTSYFTLAQSISTNKDRDQNKQKKEVREKIKPKELSRHGTMSGGERTLTNTYTNK